MHDKIYEIKEEEGSLNHIDDFSSKSTKNHKNDYVNNFNKISKNKNKLFTYDHKGKNIKQKYYSNFIFTTKFPETEYKVRFLDNYLQKDSLKRNIFGNNEETKESKTNIKTNINNGNRKISSNDLIYSNNSIEKGNIKKQNYSSNDLRTYNTNYILSTNSNNNNNIIDSNSKYDQNMSLNFYMPASKRSSDKTIDNYYKMIINNIDNKLFNIHKPNKFNKKPDIQKKIDKTFSSDKIKTYTDISFKNPINTFRDSALQNKQFYNNNNNNYGGLFNKIDRKNGGLKLLAH